MKSAHAPVFVHHRAGGFGGGLRPNVKTLRDEKQAVLSLHCVSSFSPFSRLWFPTGCCREWRQKLISIFPALRRHVIGRGWWDVGPREASLPVWIMCTWENRDPLSHSLMCFRGKDDSWQRQIKPHCTERSETEHGRRGGTRVLMSHCNDLNHNTGNNDVSGPVGCFIWHPRRKLHATLWIGISFKGCLYTNPYTPSCTSNRTIS